MPGTSRSSVRLLIIGGGVAGYTSAIYAGRASLAPILYEGSSPGGQLSLTKGVENYPGYPDGVLAGQMIQDFRRQALRFGADLRHGVITKVDFNHLPYRFMVDDAHELMAEAVIVATGASPKWLGLPEEARFYGKGVSSCAVCDGFFYQNQEVAVVGGGDSAAEAALYLAGVCKMVHLVVRRKEMRASAIMEQRVKSSGKIQIHWGHGVIEILGKEVLEKIHLVEHQTQKTKFLAVKGLFVTIGHKPNTELFAGQLHRDQQGYLVTASKGTATNIPGVFAAGDVQDPQYRQVITAAATGCMAALEAGAYLSSKGQ